MVSKTLRVPLKALMVVDPFYPCPQSSSQRIHSFAQAFSRKGFRVAVIAGTCCRGIMRAARSSEKSYTVYDLRCPGFLLSLSSVTINPLLVILYGFFSAIIATKERPDVVFASVPNGEVAIAGFFVSKIFRIPFAVDMRDLFPFPSAREIINVPISPAMSKLLTYIFHFLYRNSEAVTCVYPRIKKELVTAGVPADRISVIPNGADTSIYRQSSSQKRREIRLKYGLPLDKLIFVYAGTLASYYPTHDLIQGFSKAYQKEKRAQLLFITFRGYEHYKRMAEELELGDAVRFMGPLSVVETAGILSACDVGLIPFSGDDRFLTDMYGAKIFSYMACGLPILASGPPGGLIEDFAHEFQTGFFVGKPSANSFARGYFFFFKNKEGLEMMGKNARKLVEEHYDRKRIGMQLASLLHSLSEKERHGHRL